MSLEGPRAVAVIVTDSSPAPPPVKGALAGLAEHGRGLHLVEALPARWGWMQQHAGKSVYAILTRQA